MIQVLSGGCSSNTATVAGSVRYNQLQSGRDWWTSTSKVQEIMPTAGTISRLYVKLAVDPTNAGSGYTFTLMVDGVATALSCTINAGATEGSDLVTAPINVVAGQAVALRCTTGAVAPLATTVSWSTLFTGSNDGESLSLGVVNGQLFNVYSPVQGYGENVTESIVDIPMPTSGSFKNLYVKTSIGPGLGDSYRWTLYKNGAATALTVTISGFDTSGNDVAHSVAVAAGDRVSIFAEPINVPTNVCTGHFGMVFEPDTDGESLITGGTRSGTIAGGATMYKVFNMYQTFGATESAEFTGGQREILKNFYAKISAAPGAGKTSQIYARENSASGGIPGDLCVNISDANKTGNDTVNQLTVSDGDSINIMYVAAAGAIAASAQWSLVGKYAGGAAPPKGRAIGQLVAQGII